MALPPGTTIGPYEVTATLGAGGMGEVYLAHDSRLKRDVALKLLPESFATDPERLARFQREAEVLASLNHPHIAGILGLEETDGTKALVLELVEGETLADRILRGPIPVDEALPLAKQIAEALEAAHEHGVIHRDLKPANIKITPDGVVKVLDFGLAKAMEPAAGASVSASMSPTITTPAMTQAGMILGTAAYMSPEQARGKPVNKRADIWAFGCVVFEMLTGRRAFEGEGVQETLARVIQGRPDWMLLARETPEPLRRLLRRCLEREPRERLSDIGVARLEIREAASPATEATGTLASQPPTAERFGFWWQAGAAVFIVISVFGWALALTRAGDGGQEVSRSTILLQQDVQLATIENPAGALREFNVPLAMSDDGRVLYFVGERDGERAVYRRSIDGLDAEMLPGTEGAEFVFLSPDETSLGFIAERQIK